MFDASLRARWAEAGDRWRFEVPGGWGQGRSTFGGLSVAAAAGLGRKLVDPARPLRSFTAQLMSPIGPGSIEGQARVLREGRSASFVELRLTQCEREVLVAHFVFTAPREGGLRVAGAPPFRGPPPESLVDYPYEAGVTPEFTQHVAMRWASGAPPFSGAAEPKFTGYCRYRVPAGDLEGLIGLLDFWPNPSISLLTTRVFASTVSWSAQIFAVPASFDQWFAFEYETIAGAGGFHSVTGRLHDASGALLAATEQLVAVFD